MMIKESSLYYLSAQFTLFDLLQPLLGSLCIIIHVLSLCIIILLNFGILSAANVTVTLRCLVLENIVLMFKVISFQFNVLEVDKMLITIRTG